MESVESAPPTTCDVIRGSLFSIGGEDKLSSVRRLLEGSGEPQEDERRLCDTWDAFLREARIQVGTLLRTDSVSFLLGAGCSRHAGGVLLRTVPIEIERGLLKRGAPGTRVGAWLKVFYAAVEYLAEGRVDVGTSRPSILARRDSILASANVGELAVNVEALLSLLFRWRNCLSPTTDEGRSNAPQRLRIDGRQTVDVQAPDLDACILRVKQELASLCLLPSTRIPTSDDPLQPHKDFLKKVLTRPLNLKRPNLFTLNYDTLLEQSADAEGVVLLDGFVGCVRRVFRPESYDQDLYFPAETTEGRVHRLDRVVHLYKLHGSITWQAQEPCWDNPYGVHSVGCGEHVDGAALIYPTPAKYGETLGLPYSELFRRFAAAIVRPQSTLFVCGYGFGDAHVNSIILQALALPSFTLVVVDPYPPEPDSRPGSPFLARLRTQQDRRVWIIGGQHLATFPAFVSRILPDLRDEDIQRKVTETHRALSSPPRGTQQGDRDGE
ncbi:MAG: SIR2 family protein [Thermoanaerobaculaceae bacterium]